MAAAASCASGSPTALTLLRALAAAVLAVTWLSACDASESGGPAARPVAEAQPSPEPADGAAGGAKPPQGSGYDFYVLSLSWSPSYCEAEGGEANRQQCDGGRPYAFVVHGLWPQYERGYPADCPVDDPDVPSAIMRTLYDIMPSSGLIRHQWRKHGSCTGLSQADYFAVLRRAREAVRVPPEFARLDQYRTVRPDEVEQSFRKANAGLPADGIAVTCDARYLREVRICMTRALAFRGCEEVDRRACRAAKAVMPPVRGR